MRARRLQEAFTRSILPFWKQENASSSQRQKTLTELFNDCSSLSVPVTLSQLDSWRNFWGLQPENEGGNLFSFDASINGWVEPRLLWRWKLPVLIKYKFLHFLSAEVFIISFSLGLLQERVIVALLRRLHRSRWAGNLYICGLPTNGEPANWLPIIIVFVFTPR